jgi:hypothetical protein
LQLEAESEAKQAEAKQLNSFSLKDLSGTTFASKLQLATQSGID